jgi:putative membrane protein
MLWLKALHLVFVVAWFAGLFYLPRLFVYHVDVSEPAAHERFKLMERRLLAITHLAGALAAIFGVSLLVWWQQHAPNYQQQGWLHAKLTLVAVLISYHFSMAHFVRVLREQRNVRSARWFRIYNEVPALLLIGIVVLVVVKPF